MSLIRTPNAAARGSPTSEVGAALRHARANRGRFLDELKRLVAFPTVSAQPAHAGDIRRAATWLARHLRDIGLHDARVVPTGGHPAVTASWRGVPGRPTILVYGHYDVQPADPLAAWRTPPFVPTVVGDELRGRGSSDNKGPLFAHVKAIESILRTAGRLPVNVLCLFEGEEEVGSPNLARLLRRPEFAADIAVISDTRMLGPDRPALTYALRGSLALEVEVRGPRRDLHSGSFGGAIHNPLQVLCELVAGLHDASGRVRVAGFYDGIRPVDRSSRAVASRSGPSDAEIRRNAGVVRGWGEPGYSLHELTTIRPALTVNGLTGGYQGPGGKSIIPARASAKLGIRLVPDQDPFEVERLIRAHLALEAPEAVRVSVRRHSAARPVLLDPRHPASSAAAFAYRRAFGASPVLVRSGGTIPVVASLRALGIPTVLMGFALPDAGMHAPNERFHIPTFHRAIAAVIWFLSRLGRGEAVDSGRRPPSGQAGGTHAID